MEDPRLLGTVECADGRISGGLLASDPRSSRGDRCLVRTQNETLIAVMNSEHCKWCKGNNAARDSGVSRNRQYLRLLLARLGSCKALKVTEFVVDLLTTQPDADDSWTPVSYTEPLCKILNVRHISGSCLDALIDLDQDFVWGYNLIFSP